MRHQGSARAAEVVDAGRTADARGDHRAQHTVGRSVREFAAGAVTGFTLVGGELHVEQVPLAAIAAQHGTPCYVYSRAAIEAAYRAFDDAFDGVPHLVCYAM